MFLEGKPLSFQLLKRGFSVNNAIAFSAVPQQDHSIGQSDGGRRNHAVNVDADFMDLRKKEHLCK